MITMENELVELLLLDIDELTLKNEALMNEYEVSKIYVKIASQYLQFIPQELHSAMIEEIKQKLNDDGLEVEE